MSRYDYKLDKEEQEILDAIENGDWKAVTPTKPELRHYAQIARNTLKKNKMISIRMSELDYNQIKSKAIEEGIPYQTLISSIVHKYVSGRLISTRELKLRSL